MRVLAPGMSLIVDEIAREEAVPSVRAGEVTRVGDEIRDCPQTALTPHLASSLDRHLSGQVCGTNSPNNILDCIQKHLVRYFFPLN